MLCTRTVRHISLSLFEGADDAQVQDRIKKYLVALQDKDIPPSVAELHLILVSLRPENVDLVTRLQDISASPQDQIDLYFLNSDESDRELSPSSEFQEDAREQTPQYDNNEIEDSACFPSPLRPKPSIPESMSAVSASVRHSCILANDDIDQSDGVVSDGEEPAEPDEDDEDELASENEEDPRVKALDAMMLPQIRPDWVKQVPKIIVSQQPWKWAVGPIEYLRDFRDTRPSLTSPPRRTRSLPPRPDSSPKQFPSSPPSPGGPRHPIAGSCVGNTPSEPEETTTPPLEVTPTPGPRNRQCTVAASERYNLRPIEATSRSNTAGQVDSMAQRATTNKTNVNKPYLQQPPKRRRTKGVNELAQRENLPVCERIKSSYALHPEIPLRVVNPLKTKCKQFDLFQASGNNARAILTPSTYDRIKGWWQEWEVSIPFDLNDERLISRFHHQKAGIVSLHSSTAKASAAVDVVRILGKHVARVDKYSVWLDFLHLCVLRVCVYWEADSHKA
jgi:hypothetical protein